MHKFNTVTDLRARLTGLLFLKTARPYVPHDLVWQFLKISLINLHGLSCIFNFTFHYNSGSSNSRSRRISHIYWRFAILFQGRRIYLKQVRIRTKTIQIYKWDSTPTPNISMSNLEMLFTIILPWKTVARQWRWWHVILGNIRAFLELSIWWTYQLSWISRWLSRNINIERVWFLCKYKNNILSYRK